MRGFGMLEFALTVVVAVLIVSVALAFIHPQPAKEHINCSEGLVVYVDTHGAITAQKLNREGKPILCQEK